MQSENGVSDEERERRIGSPAGRRLVEATRLSIGRRGIAASTFDRIAPEAGVSRGSIAWYFGTKERLLAEVMRVDAEERLARLSEETERAGSLDELIAAWRGMLAEFLDGDEGAHVAAHEMATLAVQNGSIGAVHTELRRRWRQSLAGLLEAKEREGTIGLAGGGAATASLLTALAFGIASEALADPAWDRGETEGQAAEMARAALSP